MKPAPALTRRLRTVTVKPVGAPSSGVVGQRILRLGHAHRQVAEAQLRQALELLLGGGGQHRLSAAVYPAHNGVELIGQGALSG